MCKNSTYKTHVNPCASPQLTRRPALPAGTAVRRWPVSCWAAVMVERPQGARAPSRENCARVESPALNAERKRAPTPSSQGDFDCRGRPEWRTSLQGGGCSLCASPPGGHEAGHIPVVKRNTGLGLRRELTIRPFDILVRPTPESPKRRFSRRGVSARRGDCYG